MQSRIRAVLTDHFQVQQQLLEDVALQQRIESVARLCIAAFRADAKVLFCGNGGSAADAQHLAAELSGRFLLDRPPLFAEAMHVNTSFLTAVANDYDYETTFARLTMAMGREGDVLFALSTSGNSPNVLRAAEAAKRIGMHVVGMTGQTGGQLADRVDYLLNMPAASSARIQECHILVGHLICELVEAELFGASQ